MSSSQPKTRHRPTARDSKILEHVARYHLTTVEVLRRGVLPELSPNALSKIANRLCDGGYLRKYTLLHPTRYFVLGEAGANLLGLGGHRIIPLGPQSLPTECAVLFYATLGKVRRMRLTPAEVLRTWPWLPVLLAQSPHCLEVASGVLELIRVDLGGPANHVARKCALAVNARRRLREFPGLVAKGQFRLVVITMTKEKAAAIRQALDRHDWPKGLLVHLSIVSQLLPLTASHDHA